MEEFITFIGILIIFILLLRAIGSWMLRINDVINTQKETNKLLEKILKELKNNENNNQ